MKKDCVGALGLSPRLASNTLFSQEYSSRGSQREKRKANLLNPRDLWHPPRLGYGACYSALLEPARLRGRRIHEDFAQWAAVHAIRVYEMHGDPGDIWRRLYGGLQLNGVEGIDRHQLLRQFPARIKVSYKAAGIEHAEIPGEYEAIGRSRCR